MSKLFWLLFSVPLLAGCNTNDSTGEQGAAGPQGPAGPQGVEGAPLVPNVTCAADQVLTLAAGGWTCVSPAPMVVSRVRQGRLVTNPFTGKPISTKLVNDARVPVSCPSGWQLVQVSCSVVQYPGSTQPPRSGFTSFTRDHRQVVESRMTNAAVSHETTNVWIADSSYVPEHIIDAATASIYDEYGKPFDFVLPGNVIDANGTSGSCSFDVAVEMFDQAVLLADGICLQAPAAPIGTSTCDGISGCQPL